MVDDKKNTTTHNKPVFTRRKAVKSLTSGAVVLTAYYTLPAKWEKPIIGQILLPAHAQTSGITISDPCQITLLSGTTGTDTVRILAEGFVLPPIADLSTLIEAVPQGAGNPVSLETITAADGTFGAELLITGGPGITAVQVTTSVAGATGSATCQVDLENPPEPPPPDPDPEVTLRSTGSCSGCRPPSPVDVCLECNDISFNDPFNHELIFDFSIPMEDSADNKNRVTFTFTPGDGFTPADTPPVDNINISISQKVVTVTFDIVREICGRENVFAIDFADMLTAKGERFGDLTGDTAFDFGLCPVR